MNPPKQVVLNKPLKLLIVDDHPIVREGLEAVISLESDFSVEGSAGSTSEAHDLIDQLKPDIVVVDISLPGRNGIDLIKDIRKTAPKTLIVVYTMHEIRTYAQRAFKAGALGYVMKEQGASKVVEAIREAIQGKRFIAPSTSGKGEFELPASPPADPEVLPMGNLSDRQLEIFELVGHGLNSQAIGEKLSLSHKTVNAHKMNIQDRLGIGSARELLMAATRWVDRH